MSNQQPIPPVKATGDATPAKRTVRAVTRQDSIPCPRTDNSQSRRASQPAPQAHTPRAHLSTNGHNAVSAASGSLSARTSSSQMSPRQLTGREQASSLVLKRNLKPACQPTTADPISSSGAEPAAKIAGSRKKPELGKGRLERGKQISHLGLFPLTENKQVQRQSTSMTAEAGDDHLANLEDVISSNQHEHKKHSTAAPWKKQIDHVSRYLLDYAESHPQFSSQLTSCRMNNIIGLKTMKSIKGDQLTLSITLDITSTAFDSNDPKTKNGLRKTPGPVHKSPVNTHVSSPKEPRQDVELQEPPASTAPEQQSDHNLDIPPNDTGSS